ncbi:MAG: Methyltransferase protein, partial [Modestobacter sp.]|nr:Methyltransferase protein [Modestobacter sp.]
MTDPVSMFGQPAWEERVHLPEEQRRALFDRLAEGVAPGGTLLIVGHSAMDLHT